ncbi:MAG TPA: SDR family oxidoreductase [Cyclobacteriaceae bacterium]|nr:SDR family oxidoreductase [Cyclobacteriaceae bacterium]HMV08835.1 SDR family oxidoreductase [Cyclobacteriaceae bacterium]HMW99981.1 SDR family oxidoreductase [Cyclobacteriaceae bacterium]HMX49156.1 SDR family oxidoreductase [Cyclobacteriaceae bacterium]HMY92802.1 SDR family oxidoreductase [Cyclobacteriaceae bacterium]
MTKKIILVTGANRGIGKEIARQMADLGWQVIVAARNFEAAQTTAKELGHDALPVHLDVTDEASVESAAKTVTEKFGRLDVLVNNAAIMGNAPMRNFDMNELEQTMSTNFMGPIRASKYFMPLLKQSDDARIINLSSGMGELASLRSGGYAAYRLSKTSLNAFTILLASELQSVKVFAMCPGWVQTDMGGKGAPRTVSKGAETAVWLATDRQPVSGNFYRDKKVINW